MGRSCVVTALLVLSVITLARGQQYLDILQGLQQLFQPYQGNNPTSLYNVNTRPQTHKQTNRQESKKKTEHRHHTEERRTKKPTAPTNQYEYVFATTEKPRQKTTKTYSSQNSSNSRNNKNQSSNIYFAEYYNPFEVTTKVQKVTTTTEAYNNFYNKATTENTFGNFNGNRPVTEFNYDRKDSYVVNQQPPRRIFEKGSNKRPASVINNSRNEYNQNQQISNNNRGNSNTDRGILNTDYNLPYPNSPTNNQNTNVFGNNNRNQNNNAFLNTDYNPNTNNNFDNRGTSEFNRPKPNRPNVYDTDNNFGNGFNNRGTTNTNTNNRVPPNNFNTNTNNRVPPNNFNTNNNYNPNGNTLLYPSGTPIINNPGVRPAPVDVDLPPITNSPVTEKNNFLIFNRPSDNSGTFTEQPTIEPEILIGPDEDDMTNRQKRRYIDLAERMCDRYKALTVKKVVALPLLPVADPVEVDVTPCTPFNSPLIIGGVSVNIKDFPHMALVGWMKTRQPGYSWKCGASLISEQYLLTAGHCTYQDKDYDAVSGPPQAVQLGSSYLDDPGALVMKISAVIRHPKYKIRRAYHDVALIKMVSKVEFSEVIRPACLGVPPPEGKSVIATGWGRTEFGGDHSSDLRSVSLNVWNMEECREIWGTSLKLPNGVSPDSHMCAGDRSGGKDTCQGDSGGPAQIQDGCLWRVVAVTSFGRSCGAPHTPALYAVIPRAFVAAQVFSDRF